MMTLFTYGDRPSPMVYDALMQLNLELNTIWNAHYYY